MARPAEILAEALRTVKATPTRVRATLEITGSLEPIQSVQLGFDVGGRIKTLRAERGDRVQKGAALAQLDDTMARAQLDQARGGCDAAKAHAKSAQSGLLRVEKLGDALSEQKLVDAQSGTAGAVAMLRQAEAAVSLAETNLRWHTLRSPIQGVVTNGPDNAGILVGPGNPIFVIEDLSAYQLKASAPESAEWLAAGQKVSLDIGGTELSGTVKRVLPSLDPATRRIPVEVIFENPPPQARAHAFVRARVTGPELEGLYEVPREALVTRGQFAVVIKTSTGEPRLVPVEVVEERKENVAVRGNLSANDSVVLSPPAGYAEK